MKFFLQFLIRFISIKDLNNGLKGVKCTFKSTDKKRRHTFWWEGRKQVTEDPHLGTVENLVDIISYLKKFWQLLCYVQIKSIWMMTLTVRYVLTRRKTICDGKFHLSTSQKSKNWWRHPVESLTTTNANPDDIRFV